MRINSGVNIVHAAALFIDFIFHCVVMLNVPITPQIREFWLKPWKIRKALFVSRNAADFTENVTAMKP